MLKWLTSDYLKANPNYIIVYDSRTKATQLPDPTDESWYYSANSFGFRTIKSELSDCRIPMTSAVIDYTNNYYILSEYHAIFYEDWNYFLNNVVLRNISMKREVVYLITPIGRGRHNKYQIYNNIIFPNFFKLLQYRHVRWLNFWECDCYDAEEFSINKPWLSCWDSCQSPKDSIIAQSDISNEVWKKQNDVLNHQHLLERSMFPERFPEYKK